MVALALSLGLFAIVAQARSAEPEPVPISVGGADWGLKESFRKYIEGPIAHGSISVEGGASRNADGSFHFPVAGGSYHPETKSTAIALAGSVHFTGHEGQLEMTVSDLSVEIAPQGAGLFADVVSRSLADGEPVAYPNTHLAALDVSGVEPLEDEGTTSWTAIPTELTAAGAPAFAGFYSAGTELDPLSFSYEGPGGRPDPEQWTAPGTPGYEEIAAEAEVNGTEAMFVDEASGVLHVASQDGVRALDLETLSERGSIEAAATLPQHGYAFDADNGAVFAVPDSGSPGPVRAFTWNAESGEYAESSIAISATEETLLAYEPQAEKLYAVDGSGFPATEDGAEVDVPVEVASRDGADWEVDAYPDLNSEDRGISGLLAVGEGKLVATRHAYFEGSMPPVFPVSAVALADSGAELTATPIPGTVPPPPASGFTFGYAGPAAGPGGSVILRETTLPAPVGHMTILTPQVGGFAVSPPVDLGANVNDVVTDAVDGWSYVLKPNSGEIGVVVDGEVAATLDEPPDGATELKASHAAAHDGTLYFHNNSVPVGVHAYRHAADSPAITAHPNDVAVEVSGEDGTATATFTAAATGKPAPAVRWQERPAGSIAWSNVEGAEASTLEVEASAAAAGSRYRAVFANQAGAIATEPATLSVQVLPKADPEPPADDADPDPAGSSDSQGSPPPPPPPGARRPLLRPAAVKLRAVRRNGVAFVARVGCRPPMPCVLRTRRFARVRIGRRAFRVRVVAPRAVMAGRWAQVRLWLPKGARRALRGRRGRVVVPVLVRSGDQRLARAVRAVLRTTHTRRGSRRAGR